MPRDLGWSDGLLLEPSLVTDHQLYARIQEHLVILHISFSGHSTSYQESLVCAGGDRVTD
jgi:hypothetical protein